ncbi:MAG: hypothetical protein WC178_03545 [Candidatus Paceibacterota bacterium]|jgi:hypothetical protein
MHLETYHIVTQSGRLAYGCELKFLSEDELKEFNKIGYTGKNLNEGKETYEHFLNRLNLGVFAVIQTKYDSGDLTEMFIIVRGLEGD